MPGRGILIPRDDPFRILIAETEKTIEKLTLEVRPIMVNWKEKRIEFGEGVTGTHFKHDETIKIDASHGSLEKFRQGDIITGSETKFNWGHGFRIVEIKP